MAAKPRPRGHAAFFWVHLAPYKHRSLLAYWSFNTHIFTNNLLQIPSLGINVTKIIQQQQFVMLPWQVLSHLPFHVVLGGRETVLFGHRELDNHTADNTPGWPFSLNHHPILSFWSENGMTKSWESRFEASIFAGNEVSFQGMYPNKRTTERGGSICQVDWTLPVQSRGVGAWRGKSHLEFQSSLVFAAASLVIMN